MERLEKLINILKLTPHRQPELVKEASHRILSRPIRTDPLASCHLRPLIEILILYCDNDDSAQRSLFNDYLSSVVLTYQQQNYQLIFQTLLDQVINNGSARAVSTALQRIPYLIQNVQPIDLGCEPQRLLKALIEVSRRSDDESVLKALDFALERVMPYIEYDIRKSKEMQLLSNSLIEILIRNLQNDSAQTRRLAATSLSTICLNSELELQNTLKKLVTQLEDISKVNSSDIPITNKFIGLCLCAKELPTFAEKYHNIIIKVILKQIEINRNDATIVIPALETLKELFKFQVEDVILEKSVELIVNEFLFKDSNGSKVIKDDAKVILQANALACISAVIRQKPVILDKLESIFLFRDHSDIAVRNQLITIIGNYIEAAWKFPNCIEQPVNCEKIRKLWLEIRLILNDDNTHPDTLKTCVNAIKVCVNTLLESDHCLHIIEYHDFDCLIHLYSKSNFKPFKIEVLSLFASLNYRTLSYLERSHWSKMKAKIAGSFTASLQDRIIKQVIIASLVDEHQRIRLAATSALVTIIPNLYILNAGQKNIYSGSSDPIVSLAHSLANEHLVVLKQADEHINHPNSSDETVISSESHERLCIRNDHKFLTSAIIQSFDNPYNEQSQSQVDITKSQHRVKVTINLMHAVGLLKHSIEDSIEMGKVAISSIVRTLYELSLVYPIHQYSASWDCRPSEYCECFTLLNFLLTYLENLSEPDVIVEDLEAYRYFLALSQQLLYGLCHESVLNEYEHQKMKPYHKRQASMKEGYWSELTLKHPCINDLLEVYFTHLTKLLWLASYIIEERSNPFSMSSKQPLQQQQKTLLPASTSPSHDMLVSNRLLFGRVHKKLESSFKSSKKNLNQHDEKFYQILETCLSGMSSLLEFIGMNKSMEFVKDILGYLKITSPTCGVSSLICARQLLKSLFGINILALYQLDPNDWFEEESWSTSPSNLISQYDSSCTALQGVYHHLVANPYKIFSSYYSINCSQITPTSDKALEILNFESRRALKVRRRIEERVKSLFEIGSNQYVPPKIGQISESLKNIITEFTPIVIDCMSKFNMLGFSQYQSESLHFMSYLILLRVNYQKLALAGDLVASINKLLDRCGEKVFQYRRSGMEVFLRNSFTFLTLLSYERGASKPMFQVATVIQKMDDMRAKLSMTTFSEENINTYVVPLLRCLVEDLFIYRTKYFQSNLNKSDPIYNGDSMTIELAEQSNRDPFEQLEAERETVAQKLLDIIDNPRVYDLLSILILESRRNSSEIKYKKLSQHLLAIIPSMLSKCNLNFTDYRCIESTRRILENISPEVFQPVNFIFETLLETPKPISSNDAKSRLIFQRWMSLVIISIHILITQVKEEVFLSRLRETMSPEMFVQYLLHIAQLCKAEILLQLHLPISSTNEPGIIFLSQQLSSYILYLTHMFQSGLFFQLSRSAADVIRREVEVRSSNKSSKSFGDLCMWARATTNGFSLHACEEMFYHSKLIYPDLTIFWCNLMMLLNNVDCNRDYWRDLLVYECHHCQTLDNKSLESLSLGSSAEEPNSGDDCSRPKDESRFKRSSHIKRPSSLNLSDISFSDQLRRSFIKKIAAAESCDKAFNRNIIQTSGEDGQPLEREVNIGNTEQCLSPNSELTRRGALCLVLDFVTISMNDVEHITWLIIHHINDIIRWSHETPISEFINAVHGNSASSGIFIQAINSRFNNLSSISFVTRLLWTLKQVHYTQYGSLVVLLVEKLLSSEDLVPYRSLTSKVEEFACATVQKLLNDTNKSLVTTNDEVVNQLTAEDLDRINSLLNTQLYPKLSSLLMQLHESTCDRVETPTIELHQVENLSDQDSEIDEIEVLHSKANMIYWLTEQNCTAHTSSLIPALNIIKTHLSELRVLERVNEDKDLVNLLISTVYSLALSILPPPTRLTRPKAWSNCQDTTFSFNVPMIALTGGDKPTALIKPIMPIDFKQRGDLTPKDPKSLLSTKTEVDRSDDESIEAARVACLKGLFLVENIEYLRVSQFECLEGLIIRLARLSAVNSFILVPPTLWRQNIWPLSFDENDRYKTNFPMVVHEILSKDYGVLSNFCDRLLKLGWTSRRQFEEAWMTLLGVLSTSLSQPENPNENQEGFGAQDNDKKTNLLISCKVVATITKLLSLTGKTVMGDPLSQDSHPVQTYEARVVELTLAIASNYSSLRKKTKSIFESLDIEKRSELKNSNAALSLLPVSSTNSENHPILTGFSHHLKISAQKLRMNAILNVETGMQDSFTTESYGNHFDPRKDEVDVESCIRLLLSIYKQKFKDPNENLCPPTPTSTQSSDRGQQVSGEKPIRPTELKNRPNQLAPPLATAICQSIVVLSDLFTDYEQFDWLFETFVQMFRSAERNEDEIQMQYLILGLCKAASVCCYEIPSELTTATDINHREIMFEKCRQSIDKCMKSDFGPLKLNALFGVYYMLEDSINIVASGAWELDHFKQLRKSRLNWILKLSPLILDKENSKLLSKRPQMMQLLEFLIGTIVESDMKAI